MTQLKLLSGMKKEMEEAISEATDARQKVDHEFEVQEQENQSKLSALHQKLESKVARVTFLRKELDAARALRTTSAAAEGDKIQECIEQYEDEVSSQEDDLEAAYSPICIKMVVDGEKQRQVDFNFYMADVKSMMIGATPEAVRKIQSYILEAAGVQMKEGWQDDQLQFRALRNLRLDAGDMVLIAAGIELAKAKRLLALWVDETEKQLISQLSVMIIYLDEHGEVKWLSLGSQILRSKTAAESVRCMLEDFANCKLMHTKAKQEYGAMIQKLEAGEQVNEVSEEEWKEIRDAGGYSADDIYGKSHEINPSRYIGTQV